MSSGGRRYEWVEESPKEKRQNEKVSGRSPGRHQLLRQKGDEKSGEDGMRKSVAETKQAQHFPRGVRKRPSYLAITEPLATLVGGCRGVSQVRTAWAASRERVSSHPGAWLGRDAEG